MGSSIFAEESGDDSAPERRTASGPHSVFREREDDQNHQPTEDDDG
jgi:hypothetical protein